MTGVVVPSQVLTPLEQAQHTLEQARSRVDQAATRLRNFRTQNCAIGAGFVQMIQSDPHGADTLVYEERRLSHEHDRCLGLFHQACKEYSDAKFGRS